MAARESSSPPPGSPRVRPDATRMAARRSRPISPASSRRWTSGTANWSVASSSTASRSRSHTTCHPGTRPRSPSASSRRSSAWGSFAVLLAFPYGTGQATAADWSHPDAHVTEMRRYSTSSATLSGGWMPTGTTSRSAGYPAGLGRPHGRACLHRDAGKGSRRHSSWCWHSAGAGNVGPPKRCRHSPGGAEPLERVLADRWRNRSVRQS